jgi:hypothetical protein
MRNTVIGVLFLCFLLGNGVAVCGQESRENYRLVFSTFDVSSAGNYAYLRDGIQSMLVSRLAAKDRFEVLDRTIADEELSAMKDGRQTAGGAMKPPIADFLVGGALYNLKSGLNVQVALYPFAPEKEILRFSIVTNTPDTLIADIEQLAGEMAQAATGKEVTDSTRRQAMGEAGGTSAFVTAHPEAAFKKGQYSGMIVGTPGSVLQTSALGSKRKITLPAEMTAMTVTDTDGDGIGEVFVLSGRKLELYKVSEKSIDKVAETLLPKNIRSHAINAADLDKDGRLELYISATDGLDVSSTIVTWDRTNGFRIAAENISWYLRPLLLPGKGWRLAGQKRGADRIEFVREGVYLMNTDGTFKPSQGERLPLPQKINLFDFVYADLDGDGVPETVAIDQKERMRVYNQANELLWVSERSFGGSKVYLGPSPGDAVNRRDKNNLTVDEGADRQLIFVPGRLLVADLGKDGRQEIIVNENTMPALGFFDKPLVSFFNKLRTYKEGMVVGLAWNGTAMNEMWRTGKFRGYIADHGFSVLERTEGAAGQAIVSDSQKTLGRLFVGQIPDSGSLASLLPGSDDSELTVYDLEFSSEKSK